MINWKRIAELLTTKWLAEGKLPYTTKGHFEFDLIFPTRSVCNTYDFAPVLQYGKETDRGITVWGKIEPAEAFREVWPLLTDTEKTAIMAETLGAHVLGE